MEQLGLDLELLSMETFQLAREMANRSPEELEKMLQHQGEHQLKRLDRSWRLPEQSGLFYRPEIGQGTYCLRGYAVDNLKEAFQRQANQILKALKLTDWDEAQWYTFVTPNESIAEVLCDQMMNKRLPMHEESLCNLSDPAMNWWYRRRGNSMTLYSGVHKGFDNKGFLSLGPLGDPNLAQRRWQRFMDFLGPRTKQFGLVHFSVQQHQMVWEFASGDSPMGIALEQWLQKGTAFPEEYFPAGQEAKMAQLYLREVAYARQLWLQMEELLFSAVNSAGRNPGDARQ